MWWLPIKERDKEDGYEEHDDFGEVDRRQGSYRHRRSQSHGRNYEDIFPDPLGHRQSSLMEAGYGKAANDHEGEWTISITTGKPKVRPYMCNQFLESRGYLQEKGRLDVENICPERWQVQ